MPPRSKAVTIVLGIKTPQGVVLSADTQESYQGSHKVNRPKLVYHSETNICDLAIGMAVAGSGLGPSIDKVTTQMWEAIQEATSLDEACLKAENAIKDFYREYRELTELDNDELIYGIGASGATRLFHAWGPVVNETNRRASGYGQAVADFLLRHFRDTTHITNAMSWAIYILYSAKTHADYCGGDTHCAVLQNDGQNYLLKPDHIKAMENVFEKTSETTDTMLMLVANPLFDAEAIKVATAALSQKIASYLGELSAVKSIPELLERLGHSKQLGAQT